MSFRLKTMQQKKKLEGFSGLVKSRNAPAQTVQIALLRRKGNKPARLTREPGQG